MLEGHIPSVERAGQIASALDLEFYIGPPRVQENTAIDIPSSPPGPSRAMNQACLLARETAKRFERVAQELDRAGSTPGSTVAVRELRTAAGGGALDLDEAITGYVYFRTSWLRKYRLNPERCCIIGVTGESMEATHRGCLCCAEPRRSDREARGKAQERSLVASQRQSRLGSYSVARRSGRRGPSSLDRAHDALAQARQDSATRECLPHT